MSRAIVVVLDSFGVGSLADANKFGDAGSNTLGHIDEYCYQNQLPFHLPNFLSLGLGRAFNEVNKHKLHIDQEQLYKHINNDNNLIKLHGVAKEISAGKDTSSGHWEMMCCPVIQDFGYFKSIENSFPVALLDTIVKENNLPGYLGNCHASGTEIINVWGDHHVNTNQPIFYTSPDSVFQIATHEDSFGLENLYALCSSVREILEDYQIARVIARPFVGSNGSYQRTNNRRDYSLLPPQETALSMCKNHGGQVIAIGKIDDIYAQQGISKSVKAYGITDLMQATITAMQENKQPQTIIMTNLVDFDMKHGHRRDPLGYKTDLEVFDSLYIFLA